MRNITDFKSDFFKSMNEARLLDARAAVQAGLFINGLAATAVLTFLGSVAPKIEAGHLVHSHPLKAFIWSLGFFAFGVFCAALATLFSYLANHAYAEASTPFDVQEKGYVEAARARGFSAHKWAILAGLGTLKAFLAGVTAAIVGFDNLI